MGKFLCIGHRGARGHEPENTLRSIRKALDLGVDGIEIDVYAVAGELIVIHDETLDRTTNGCGRVEEQSVEILRSLDAGHGEKIPFLHEVFDVVARKAFINIELKGGRTAIHTRDLINRYIREKGWVCEDFLVSSFHLAELEALKKSGLRLGVLFEAPPSEYLALAKSLGAYSIHIAGRHASRALAQEIHDGGLKVFAYTVNSVSQIEALRQMGVDGIFTDYPERSVS